MLSQYVIVRILEEEINLVTAKLGKIFEGKKPFMQMMIWSVVTLQNVLFQDMNVQPAYLEMWWNQMRNRVRKKLDEQCSNCGNAIKKSLIGKLKVCLTSLEIHAFRIIPFSHIFKNTGLLEKQRLPTLPDIMLTWEKQDTIFFLNLHSPNCWCANLESTLHSNDIHWNGFCQWWSLCLTLIGKLCLQNLNEYRGETEADLASCSNKKGSQLGKYIRGAWGS